ncbi:MAG: acyl-CoA synthetase [Pseudomonadota bacterium]
MNPFEQHLDRNAANYQPLTPLVFLERTAAVWPDQTAILHGGLKVDYRTLYRRSRQLASALAQKYVGAGDAVSVMLPNVPAMIEAHFGVPMTGGVLHAINTRLDAQIIAFQLDHANAKVVIVDQEYAAVMTEALAIAKVKPFVINCKDTQFPPDTEPASYNDYEAFVQSGDADFHWARPADEWQAITLNYTSGTTGNPKGVVYHHRGAALMCYANTVEAGMVKHPVYLWTLPMFHCNGWCFPWTITMLAGTHVCLRGVRAPAIYDAIADHKVTHLCGAPIVMSTLLNAPDTEKREIDHRIEFITAAAPPPESVLAQMADAGFNVTHVYGLTETYGPAVANNWHAAWDNLDRPAQAQKKARQGVKYIALDDLDVRDPETMKPVPADGQTIGEIVFRGNIVMKGYLKNPKATEDAFAGGWFHSGDLAVRHPDGYVQIRDRSKDIIISGGENISSIEVEDAIYAHPSVAHCAVVAKPDETWGETPCAFIELKPGADALSPDDVIAWCKDRLASFKCPRTVMFRDIPKTSTGKIQKFKLREAARDA